jgi:hypothetical protein
LRQTVKRGFSQVSGRGDGQVKAGASERDFGSRPTGVCLPRGLTAGLGGRREARGKGEVE